jgi:hypothetical protein
MTPLDPDIWARLQSDVETQVISCCDNLYDFGQEDLPYPAEESAHYTRLIMQHIKDALAEQVRRDLGAQTDGKG